MFKYLEPTSEKHVYRLKVSYSVTLFNGHTSTVDTHDIMDNSENPNRFSIDIIT